MHINNKTSHIHPHLDRHGGCALLADCHNHPHKDVDVEWDDDEKRPQERPQEDGRCVDPAEACGVHVVGIQPCSQANNDNWQPPADEEEPARNVVGRERARQNLCGRDVVDKKGQWVLLLLLLLSFLSPLIECSLLCDNSNNKLYHVQNNNSVNVREVVLESLSATVCVLTLLYNK